MRRAALLIVLVAVPLGSAGRLGAQRTFPPATFENLQIFPKETPPDVLIAAMKNFTRDLGVRCDFCHVGREEQPLEQFDFASDAIVQKTTARVMIRMVAEVNAMLTNAHPPDATTPLRPVTCFTCHRGQRTPPK